MDLHWIYVLVLFGFASGEQEDDDGCPKQQDLVPCTCDAEGVNCMWANNLDEIKRAFKVKFPYNATRVVYVQATPIKSLPAGLFGDIKSEGFFIEMNEIEAVDMKAFSASRHSLKTLSLFENKIVEFPFQDLTYYDNIDLLNLGRNQIEVIPDNAINSRSLYTLILTENKIKQLGSNVFLNGLSLSKLEMADNQITKLGPMSLAMKTRNSQVLINLANNRISEIDSNAFGDTVPFAFHLSNNQLTTLKKDPFEVLIPKMAEINGAIEVSGNPFSCKGCDYSWFTKNKELLSRRLFGFRCEDERGINDLEESNINCN